MSIIKTLRAASACPPNGPHPYIDTPDFSYDQWLAFLSQGSSPIGTDGYPIPGGVAWTLGISIASARSASAQADLDRSIRSASWNFRLTGGRTLQTTQKFLQPSPYALNDGSAPTPDIRRARQSGNSSVVSNAPISGIALQETGGLSSPLRAKLT